MKGNLNFFKCIFTTIIPTFLFLMYNLELIILEILYFGLALFTFAFIIIPFTFKYNFTMRRNFVFLSMVNIPRFAVFKNPKHHGLQGARNFYVKTKDNCKLGTWHILPEDLIRHNLREVEEEEYFEKTFLHGHPVIVYCHGNSSNRAASHHIELHKILRRNYHVISFDYRGYGDSTGCPDSELAVVNDTITIVEWVKNLSSAPIIIWGHSIGTGVAVYATRILEHEMEFKVAGLVLENPFDNMRNEIEEHPLTLPYKLLPWFHHTMVEPICESGFLFQSDEHINYVSCPTMILHSEDDRVVPFKLGLELYNIALKKRSKDKGHLRFERFDARYGYGHKYICRAPELPNITKDFIEQCLKN